MWMDLSSLVDLPVLPVRITARALDPIRMPANAGSSLRGAFGAALYRLVCAHRERSACAGCPAEATCAYPSLFATRAGPGQPGTAGFRDLPRPYVLRAAAVETVIPPGETFTWGVTLIGRAVEQLPYFALAWRAIGDTGIGRGQGRFELDRAEAMDLDGAPAETLYDRQTNLLRPPGAVIRAAQITASLPVAPQEAGAAPGLLTVRFLTPTRLKHESQVALVPDFHLLWRSLQRRLSLLRLAHGAGRPEIAFAESIRAAEAIRLTGWTAREQSWQRYSRRQGQRVPMLGFTGTAHYAGDLAPFLPALKLGTLVGVGENCTFGQGHYEIAWG